jgi:hypothetical protein
LREHGVNKFVFVGISDLLKGGILSGMMAKFWRWVLRNITADHERVLNFLQQEGTDVGWIGIMPPQIVDNPHSGHYKTAVDKLPGARKVNSGDMAHAMVSLVTDNDKFAENNHKLLGISTSPQAGNQNSIWDCTTCC